MIIEKMYTEIEAALMLSVTVSAMRQRRIRKQPPFAKKIGRSVRYPESEILAFLEAAPTAVKDVEEVKPGRKPKKTDKPKKAKKAEYDEASLALRIVKMLKIIEDAEKHGVYLLDPDDIDFDLGDIAEADFPPEVETDFHDEDDYAALRTPPPVFFPSEK